MKILGINFGKKKSFRQALQDACNQLQNKSEFSRAYNAIDQVLRHVSQPNAGPIPAGMISNLRFEVTRLEGKSGTGAATRLLSYPEVKE